VVPAGGGFGGGSVSEAISGGGGGGRISFRSGMEATDISKIIYLGPDVTKKKLVLSSMPAKSNDDKYYLAKTFPGEITLPLNKIIKSKIL